MIVQKVLTSRQFNQDTSHAKRIAADGPVIITDRGKPAHVLMTFEEYRKLTGQHRKLTELLALPAGIEVDFDLPPRTDLGRGADLL